jgi:hypothetical protein
MESGHVKHPAASNGCETYRMVQQKRTAPSTGAVMLLFFVFALETN